MLGLESLGMDDLLGSPGLGLAQMVLKIYHFDFQRENRDISYSSINYVRLRKGECSTKARVSRRPKKSGVSLDLITRIINVRKTHSDTSARCLWAHKTYVKRRVLSGCYEFL